MGETVRHSYHLSPIHRTHDSTPLHLPLLTTLSSVAEEVEAGEMYRADDERRHLVQTSINVYADQLDTLEDSDANLSGLVRDVLDVVGERDDFTTDGLEALLAERRLLESRCDALEVELEELREELA